MEVGVKGFYKLIKSRDKECKDITYESGWMPNLITDAGMDYLSTNYLMAYGYWDILVGADNTPPAVTDTALGTLIARGTRPTYLENGVDSVNDYGWYRHTVQFGEGEAAGNIAEVGFTFNHGGISTDQGNDLFSRALVVDGGGNPTTITVLSNEFLTVVYEVRTTIMSTDINATVDIDEDGTPVSRNVVIRANGGTSTDYWAAINPVGYGMVRSDAGVSLLDYQIGQGGSYQGTVSASAYTQGSFNRDLTLFWGINESNVSVDFIGLRQTLCGSSWKMSFNPAIVKDNTKELSITFNISWARV